MNGKILGKNSEIEVVAAAVNHTEGTFWLESSPKADGTRDYCELKFVNRQAARAVIEALIEYREKLPV